MRQSISTEELELVLERMACCEAMLSVLADSERLTDDGKVSLSICGVSALLKLACESLESIVYGTGAHTEGGVQHAP